MYDVCATIDDVRACRAPDLCFKVTVQHQNDELEQCTTFVKTIVTNWTIYIRSTGTHSLHQSAGFENAQAQRHKHARATVKLMEDTDKRFFEVVNFYSIRQHARFFLSANFSQFRKNISVRNCIDFCASWISGVGVSVVLILIGKAFGPLGLTNWYEHFCWIELMFVCAYLKSFLSNNLMRNGRERGLCVCICEYLNVLFSQCVCLCLCVLNAIYSNKTDPKYSKAVNRKIQLVLILDQNQIVLNLDVLTSIDMSVDLLEALYVNWLHTISEMNKPVLQPLSVHYSLREKHRIILIV